jgi:hypothetical protein
MKVISTALLLAIAPSVSLAQPTSDTVILTLRTCVQANASAAQSAGVQTADEAIEFFIRTCNGELSTALAKPNVGPVVPGSFRRAIREEWTAFSAHTGNR